MYYFLDIDGVLNKESDWQVPFTINPECAACFVMLLKKDKDPHVVLSSTWRLGATNLGSKAPKDNSLLKEIEKYGITIEGATPISNKTRQEEIEYYIRRKGIKDYLVIDDDESLFPRSKDICLYITNYKVGLTVADVRAIEKMQKRSRIGLVVLIIYRLLLTVQSNHWLQKQGSL